MKSGNFERVPDEEDRGVVPHQVVVAVLGIELEGEAAGVAHRIGGAPATGDRGEAEEGLGLLADLARNRARVHPVTSAVTSKVP